jgi:hypothetical protein
MFRSSFCEFAKITILVSNGDKTKDFASFEEPLRVLALHFEWSRISGNQTPLLALFFNIY